MSANAQAWRTAKALAFTCVVRSDELGGMNEDDVWRATETEFHATCTVPFAIVKQ